MFSGIVTAKGLIARIPSQLPGPLTVAHPSGWGELAVGASVAVNGCCLTAVSVASSQVTVEVIPQTLRLTNLGLLRAGDPVNLEPALRLGDPVGGHLMTGHVDAVGKVVSVARDGNGLAVRISVPSGVSRYCVPQGSLAVDGCSLTLVSVTDKGPQGAEVEVSLIPHTVKVTVAGGYRVGSAVNLEADQLAKLVSRLLEPASAAPPQRPKS